MNGRYEITNRLLYLMDCETVTLKSYKEKWERGRKTFFRDLNHLRLFYGINFVYDKDSNIYKKKKDTLEIVD